jgi:maltooligosyltrehalose trehalohydrolase
VDLGVTHVSLMPIGEFSGDHGWGYDGVDLFAPHHAYGGPDGFKRFVDACHRVGLAVILDVVYNHFGPEGNYLARFGPYLTNRHTTPWGPAVNFDQAGSNEVRAFVLDNARMWLRDYHLDGFRIDAVHAIVDLSAMHILEELRIEVDHLQAELARPLVLIVESDLNDPRFIRSRDAGGLGMDAQWSDDFHHSLHTLLTRECDAYYADFGELAHLAKALRRAFVYDGQHAPTRGRRHGRSPEGLPASRFLAYAQTHDQVGNRPFGERLGHLVPPERAKLAAALVLLSPFVPMLFQGEEWGASAPFLYFTDHRDPEVARGVTEGRREELAGFGLREAPDPQDSGTFARSKLDWTEPGDGHGALLAWHRDLIRARRRFPALVDGDLDSVAVDFDEPAGWLVLRRGDIELAVNFGAEQVVPLADPARSTVVLASGQAAPEPFGLRLSGDGAALVQRSAEVPHRVVRASEARP